MSDDVIVSAGSTFSRVGYALGGIVPKCDAFGFKISHSHTPLRLSLCLRSCGDRFVNWRNACLRRRVSEPCVFKLPLAPCAARRAQWSQALRDILDVDCAYE